VEVGESVKVQYEEKTFESYFNNELDQKSSVYFPFGQVQEGIIGLDAAANSKNRSLWRQLGYPYWFFPRFGGLDLQEIAREMESFLSETVNNIPSMKVNLLFQYKRPELILTPSGKEWSHWGQRYFRYDIYLKQHNLLEHIEKSFGDKVLVLYASPAVENIGELVKVKINRAIIDNSNFCKASELNGHHRNTYIKSGLTSKAFSEPQEIANFDLLDLISSYESSSVIENRQFIIDIVTTVRASIENAEYLRDVFNDRMNEFNEIRQFELFFAFITMSVFREITGVQWIISLNEDATE
jgi:hypothetical protein